MVYFLHIHIHKFVFVLFKFLFLVHAVLQYSENMLLIIELLAI